MSEAALFLEKSGTGPPVMLLHGFTGSIRSWDAVREHLGASCTVIVADLPGHGRSPSPPDVAEYTVRNAARLAAQALDDAGIARAAVMGYSMGARTALRLALDHPDICAGLVLESASPGFATEAERVGRRAEDEARAARIERDGVRAFVREWEQLPLWQSQSQLDPETIAKQREIRLSQSAVGLASSLRGAGAGNEPSVLDELPNLAVPVLLLAGALDTLYVAHARAMAARIRSATVHIEPEAGHALHLERPLKVASLVKRFVETLGL